MTPEGCNDAAQRLWRAWRDGERLQALDGDSRPRTLADGYAIQHRLIELSGDTPHGWKLAATSAAGQAHIAVDGPIVGRLLASRIHAHPARFAFGANAMRVAEAEFAFRLGGDLPPRDTPYSRDEVMAQVATLHPSIELPDSRFADFTAVGGVQLTADNACAHRFVLGPACEADWRAADLAAHPVALTVNGEVVTRGHGRDALGDPRAALTWLANSTAAGPHGLRAGEIVTTGVCGAPSAVAAGDRVRAEFGPFGVAEVRLD